MQTTEEEDVIFFKNVCEINYYKHEYICFLMLIYLDVQMRKFSEAISIITLNYCQLSLINFSQH